MPFPRTARRLLGATVGLAAAAALAPGGLLTAAPAAGSGPSQAAASLRAGPPQPGSYPASYPWAHAAGGLFDVTAGAVRTCVRGYLCTATAGFDGPTGWGIPDTAAAFTAPPPQPSGCKPAQLLANGGFERRGKKPWVTSPYVVMKAANGVPAHSGKRLAWLAGYGTKITQRIAQQVTIRAGCTSATLTFWLQVSSTARKARAAGTLTLQAVSPAGHALATLATFSNRDAAKLQAAHGVTNPIPGPNDHPAVHLTRTPNRKGDQLLRRRQRTKGVLTSKPTRPEAACSPPASS